MKGKPSVDIWVDWTPLLAEAIRRARKEKSLSQEALARRAGIDRTYMGAVERGKHDITFEKLMQILEALNVEPQRFFTEFLAVSGPWVVKRQTPCVPHIRPHGATYLTVLGAALRIERDKCKFSQLAVADGVGMSRSSLSEIERGLRNPKMSWVMRILQSFAFDLGDFFFYIPLMDQFHSE